MEGNHPPSTPSSLIDNTFLNFIASFCRILPRLTIPKMPTFSWDGAFPPSFPLAASSPIPFTPTEITELVSAQIQVEAKKAELIAQQIAFAAEEQLAKRKKWEDDAEAEKRFPKARREAIAKGAGKPAEKRQPKSPGPYGTNPGDPAMEKNQALIDLVKTGSVEVPWCDRVEMMISGMK